MDWKDLAATVGKAAPLLGTLLLGPAGGAAGAMIASALGADHAPDAVSAALAANPDAAVKLRQIETEQQLALRKLAVVQAHAELRADVEKRKIAADTDKASLADVADARAHNAQTVGILWLGYLINAASYACLVCVLYGCFWLLGGVKMTIDPGIAAMVGGIIGAAVQWLMSNAAQANSFFFGSSPSSRQATTDLSKAVGSAVAGKADQAT